ncbi:cgcaxxgcc motif [Lucifera butyrica]|uniref:Cgcaxxgcc motif n=2 Tax=Lucifera butyrica TaxID=1351585 RepID=A0A498RA21_9FIRM|nr:cgcaxxgcc motif [Lucifera butyrica]
MSEMARIAQLNMQGFHCSQILLILGLERQGKSNPDLIRAMTGLAGGLGFEGKICGTLTGAVCLLGLYAGRGEVEEQENHRLNIMIQELVVWFEERFGKDYGGIDCRIILNEDPWNRMLRCPNVVTETYLKVMEILEDNGFVTGSEPDEA